MFVFTNRYDHVIGVSVYDVDNNYSYFNHTVQPNQTIELNLEPATVNLNIDSLNDVPLSGVPLSDVPLSDVPLSGVPLWGGTVPSDIGLIFDGKNIYDSDKTLIPSVYLPAKSDNIVNKTNNSNSVLCKTNMIKLGIIIALAIIIYILYRRSTK